MIATSGNRRITRPAGRFSTLALGHTAIALLPMVHVLTLPACVLGHERQPPTTAGWGWRTQRASPVRSCNLQLRGTHLPRRPRTVNLATDCYEYTTRIFNCKYVDHQFMYGLRAMTD